jgi:copper(I)-binding protein
MRFLRIQLAILLALSVAALPARAAESAAQSNIMVMQARAMASIPGAPTTAVYFMLHNVGASTDQLLGARTTAASKVELHATALANGIASMRTARSIEVPVGGMVDFRPGGNHLMLIGMRQPLKAGATLTLTLLFARAGAMTVEVPIKALIVTPQTSTGHENH